MQDTPHDRRAAETSPEPATDATAAPEALPSPEEALRQAEQQAKDHYDAWLRAMAEADNVRKRAQEDVAKAHRYALESITEALLPVRDSLEAALAAPNVTMESLKTGVELTLKQLAAVFEKFSIAEINPVGEKFDPHRHQAISTVESKQPPNTVVQVVQKGYELNDRLLRAAKVLVARGQG